MKPAGKGRNKGNGEAIKFPPSPESVRKMVARLAELKARGEAMGIPSGQFEVAGVKPDENGNTMIEFRASPDVMEQLIKLFTIKLQTEKDTVEIGGVEMKLDSVKEIPPDRKQWAKPEQKPRLKLRKDTLPDSPDDRSR